MTPWQTCLWHGSTDCLYVCRSLVRSASSDFPRPSSCPALQHTARLLRCIMLRTKSGTRPLSNKRILHCVALRRARQLGYNLSTKSLNKTSPFYLHQIRLKLTRASSSTMPIKFFDFISAATIAECHFAKITCFECEKGSKKNEWLHNEAFLQILRWLISDWE